MEQNLQIIKSRGALRSLKQALKTGRVTVGFAGGSITEAARTGNWPWFVNSFLMAEYPEIRFVFENTAIGGTGSLCGLMRADRELIDSGCDIVFVEYAVNDNPGEATMRTREGLIRKLLRDKRDVVLVYTYRQDMYEDMCAGKVPQSIAELEMLAEHYNLPSVWMALHAFNEQMAGRMRWEMWLPDGLHPGDFGSSLYAEAVNAYLKSELASDNETEILCGESLPEPLNEKNFENTTLVPWEKICCSGAWFEVRETHSPWYRNALFTSGNGAGLSFEFEGRALCGMLGFGKHSGKLSYRIDGGDWQEFIGERDWWVPEDNWTRPVLFCDDLAGGKHRFELINRHGNTAECKGTTCKIFSFMAVR